MSNQHPNIHECKELPATGVTVAFVERGLDDGVVGWNLIVCREATEDDLEENHYLEQIGDSIWTFAAQIRCCPYCGLRLEVPDHLSHAVGGVEYIARTETFGQFSLFDEEKWYGRRR